MEHRPWMSVIQVPHLKGWTRRFDAASANNPAVEVEEYVGILNQQQNMYGRSFRGSSIQVRYDTNGRESLDEIKKNALDLVPSLQNTLIGHIEELESAESDVDDIESDEEVVIPEDAPELRLVKVEIEESIRKRTIDVNVQLCNIDDEDDFEFLTLLSLSSEIAKFQSIAYEYIKDEIERNLGGYRVSEDTTDEILREVENLLVKNGVKIDYY